ncbi:ATP-binding cassette domain-containing protein [Streptomyces sp. NPDC056503]|uniref:ATP-binding cassette domain-containing protein n=1 Tax=Streptomyces sp. NPDC056503 TaxID=3345842 RepID=UPI00367634E2
MEGSFAIEISGLRKSFGDTEVLKGVDLKVVRGSMLALLGPNGAGKTTVVKILSTLTPLSGGTVTINGHDLVRQSDQVRGSIGVVNQFMALDYVHSGRENLVMMGRLQRIGTKAAERRAEELLRQFDLTDAADRPVLSYSGGMRRRLDLAVSLIAAPSILLLDEPTVGLDPRSRIAMWQAIQDLLAEGTTILLTTQYLEEADRLADQIAVIDQGRVIAQGTAAELKQRVGDERMELTFATHDAYAKACLAVGTAQALRDPDRLTMSFATADTSYLIGMLGRIEQSGVDIGSLAVAKPTLDDVFLALTEQPAATREAAKVPAGEGSK